MMKQAFALLAAVALALTTSQANANNATADVTGVTGQRELASKCDAWFTTPKWTSERGMILFHGIPFQIRGTNWMGMETDSPVENLLACAPQSGSSGQVHSVASLTAQINKRVAVIAREGFNAIRLPMAVSPLLNMQKNVHSGGISYADVLKAILDQAAAHGIVVLLDMHRITPCCGGGEIYTMPETPNPLQKTIAAWQNVLRSFGRHPAVFAIDLFNEPHGVANWGAGGQNDWRVAATTMINSITQAKHFWGLFFVQGDDYSVNFSGVYKKPITAGGNRVVYSPHSYGPGTVQSKVFFEASYPHNLPATYNELWGWIPKRTGRAVVVGEWGGPNNGADATWQHWYKAYLHDNCIGNFYWVLNCNGGITGGWLGDKDHVNHGKMSNIVAAQPHPSHFSGDVRKGYCFKKGALSNPKCASARSPTAPQPAPKPHPKPTPKKAHAPAPKPTAKKPTGGGGGACMPKFHQCGGRGYAGSKKCCSGNCKYGNAYYSQCQ